MLYYGMFFFFKQKTAYEMRISDWSSDVCSSDLLERFSCQSERGKTFEVRRFEVESAERREIERRHCRFHPVGPGERVRDRRAHVRRAELREDRPIAIFAHRVDHRLQVDDELDQIGRAS